MAFGFSLSVIIAVFQGWAYFQILPLSLGPRVVLQPRLMQQGYLLYEHIADEHAPLLYLLLAIPQPWFSDGLLLAKTALVVVIFATTLATYWAGYRTGGWLVGVLAALFFALWSPIFGYSKLWHETLLALLYVLLLALWRPPTSPQADLRSSLVSGLLLGLALLAKQHAAFVIAGLVLWNAFISWRARRPTRALLIESATIGLTVAFCVFAFVIYHLLQGGTFDNLVFWTIRFSLVNNYTKIAFQLPRVDQLELLIPAYVLLVPFILYWFVTKNKFDEDWYRQGLALMLIVTGSLTALPRFGLFHLQASLPILAWLSATIVVGLFQKKIPKRLASAAIPTRALFGVLASVPILVWVMHAGDAYFHALRDDQPRKIWEYSDLVPLADEIREFAGPTDCIYVLPDDEATSNLYALTGCSPPKFWVPTGYRWFTLDELKPDILAAVEQAAPEWVVYFPNRWRIEQRMSDLVAYVQSHYELKAQITWAQGKVQLLQRKQD